MFNLALQTQTELKKQISEKYRCDEQECIKNLINILDWDSGQEQKINELATNLVKKVRATRIKGFGVDALMQKFKLSTQEGIALMCLAESLLRIPDKYTQNKLIKDKIKTGDWKSYTRGGGFFVNAAGWGLLITGKIVKLDNKKNLAASLTQVIAKGGEPVIRRAVSLAVRLMGKQFVMGQTVEKALKTAVNKEAKGYQFSYDMLGEAALTDEDAQKYMQSYIDAIQVVGKANAGRGIKDGPGISVKLSAIHPRYTRSQRVRVMDELYPRLKHLYLLAKEYQIGLFIDAEEADRLEISLDLLEKLALDPDLTGFKGIGFVIQAYQRRAPYVVDYVIDLAKRAQNRIMVRLVKGAYWDSEIKKAQTDGMPDYPVFTRKFYTDLSYLACAKKLLSAQTEIYPLFATHNAYSLAAIYTLAKGMEFEFQCLYGMGETLYDNVVGKDNLNVTCRVYAPVGTHETLLAYLVRRLLENGANSSFVHQLVDPETPIQDLVVSPLELVKKSGGASNPYFNKPPFIYPDGRINSTGLDLSDERQLAELESELNHSSVLLERFGILVKPLLKDYVAGKREAKLIKNPAKQSDIVGEVWLATEEEIDIALANAVEFFPLWAATDPKERAAKVLKFADLLEANYYQLLNIIVREAGKTLANGIAEVREAVDFCRYYANQVINEFNNLTHPALGPVVCISPWNFPLAIFVGEVISSVVSGNTVIAKPSAQTNLIAYYAVKLMHEAGIPAGAAQLMPGSGSAIGNELTKDPRVKGVIFTGSTEVAQTINQNLALKEEHGVLIAETGGQNAMIVDSTALPEQVVTDVIGSAFDSAGQRCSALRVLYLQADIADKIITMLKGAMDELRVGNPQNLSTDIGPVIDTKAQKTLLEHIEHMQKQARMFYQAPTQAECREGIFVAPTVFEIGSIRELKREVFGPVLHIIRFVADNLDAVIAEINSSGYGLTQGIHSRLEENAYEVYTKVKAGNIYVNRNMVGAVVGVQPFGGEGLSGTGPKAGGPFYLYRLVASKRQPKLNLTSRTVDYTNLDKFVHSLGKLHLTPDQIGKLDDLALKLKQHSPLNSEINLPGPTGERNFMFFVPRGYVACLANDLYTYCVQIIYTLATGNQVILTEDNANDKLLNYLPKQSYFIAKLMQAKMVHAVLVSKDYPNLAKLRVDLAKRDGLLTHVLAADADGGYNLHLLVTERTVSINITATGGNVQLMSIKDMV